MIGFLTGAVFKGISVKAAETQITPNGSHLTTWTIGIGGKRDKGIPGFFVQCKVWGAENCEMVCEAVSDKGLAVIADGLPQDFPKDSGGKLYSNVSVSVYRLSVQKGDALVEIPLVRPSKDGNDGGGKKPVAAAGGKKLLVVKK